MGSKKTHFYSYQYTTKYKTGTGNGSANINSFDDVNRVEKLIEDKFIQRGDREVTVIITSIHKI